MGVATTVIPQIVIHKGHRVSVDSELYHHYESPNSSCKSWCCCCLKYSCCGLLSTILGVFVLACIGMGVMAARNGQLRRLASTETESQVFGVSSSDSLHTAWSAFSMKIQDAGP